MGREFAMRCLWQPCAWGSYNTSLCPDTFLYLAELRDYPWFRCCGISQFAHLESKTYFGGLAIQRTLICFGDFFKLHYVVLAFEQRCIACELQPKGQEMNVKCSARCDVPMNPMMCYPFSLQCRRWFAITKIMHWTSFQSWRRRMWATLQWLDAAAGQLGNPRKSSKASTFSRSFFFEAVTLSGKESWAQRMSRESVQHCGEF